MGIVEAATIDSEQVEIKVKAGGRAAIKASELAEIKVAFGGSVSVYGEPKQIIKSISVGGKIELMSPSAEIPENE